MENSKIPGRSSRRAFFLQGGAVLGAGVAATAAGATPELPPDPQLQELQQQLGSAADREAVRQLHLTLLGLLERQSYEAAADLFAEEADLDLSGMAATGKLAILALLTAQYRHQQASAMHTAYRQNALQSQDVLLLSDDRLRATAQFHAEVEVSTPLQVDSTAAQMARLQGQMADRRWENGRFHARYMKAQGTWKVASLSYRAA